MQKIDTIFTKNYRRELKEELSSLDEKNISDNIAYIFDNPEKVMERFYEKEDRALSL